MKKLLLGLLPVFLAMVLSAQEENFNWVQQTISPGNNLQEMTTVEDTLVVVGNNNVFFKSTNKGLSWEFKQVIDAIYDYSSLSINSEGNGLLTTRRSKIIDYSGITDPAVNGKILKTTDHGATWTVMSLAGITSENAELNPAKEGCFALDLYTVNCVDANKAYMYVGWYDVITGSKVTNGAVFETTDGGETWSPVTENLGSNVTTAIQTKGTATYIAGKDHLFKRTGTTTTDIYPALVAADGGSDQTIYIFDIDVISETEFYLTTTSNGIFHSTDGGATMVELGGTGVPSGGNDIKAIDANTIMVIGSSSKSKVTVDGGTTWNACYPGETCWEIEGVFNDSVYALGKDDLFKIAVADLASDPTNWKQQILTEEGINIQQMHIIDASSAIVAGNDELLKKTTNKGLEWTDVTIPELYDQAAEEQEYGVDFNGLCASEGVSYAAARRYDLESYSSVMTYYPGPIFKSTDNWKTWELLDIDEIGKENEEDVTIYPFHDDCYGFDPYSIECITDSIVFVWANWYDTVAGYDDKVTHSRVFKSTDAGVTWKSITEDLGNPFITAIHFLDKDNGYIVGNKTLLKTTDGGETLTDLYPRIDESGEMGAYFKGVTYVSENEIYFPSTADSVWLTTDQGETFTALSFLPGTNDVIKLDEDHMLALGTTSKSFLTKDAGENWIECTPGTSVWSIGGIVNDSVFALTKGDIYKISFEELTDNGEEPNGIGDIMNSDDIKLLNGRYQVEIVSEKNNIETCIVYNIIGQLMDIKHPNSESCIIDKSGYESGIYIIATFSGDKRYTHKVVF